MSEPVRVLYISSEIYPYSPESHIATVGRYLPQAVQESGREIRAFMPRYGIINERRNQLHEVIRLSGMNIIVNDVDKPLIIKVASISSARMQVYFIDNDDYFHRKALHSDESGNYFEDNDERAIFFARGVLETVKKLRWKPDIVHCQGWISHLVPLYLKKSYCQDPIFADTKVVLSYYDDVPGMTLSPEIKSKLEFDNIAASDLAALSANDGTHLAKLAVSYSDAVIFAEGLAESEVAKYASELGLVSVTSPQISAEDSGYISVYNKLYDQILGADVSEEAL